MSGRSHSYTLSLTWTGNRGTGTSAYTAYGREHSFAAPGKPDLLGSADPAFRGDATRYNPEELLVAAIASCHMLWYLHLCAEAGIVVTAYADAPIATMVEDRERGGWFTGCTLHPSVTIAKGDPEKARSLHEQAHKKCFVANSVNFPVGCEPTVTVSA